MTISSVSNSHVTNPSIVQSDTDAEPVLASKGLLEECENLSGNIDIDGATSDEFQDISARYQNVYNTRCDELGLPRLDEDGNLPVLSSEQQHIVDTDPTLGLCSTMMDWADKYEGLAENNGGYLSPNHSYQASQNRSEIFYAFYVTVSSDEAIDPTERDQAKIKAAKHEEILAKMSENLKMLINTLV